MIARLRRRLVLRRGRKAPVRGTVSNLIVVKNPAPCFREALFILRDDYLSDPSRDRESLLREAREAAQNFAGVPARNPKRWLVALLPLLVGLFFMLRFFL